MAERESKTKSYFLAALVAALFLGGFMLKALFSVPRINDITTTPSAPPSFVRLDPKPYPERNAELQTKAYSDLAPLVLGAAPADAFAAALATAEQMVDWKIENVDRNALRFEAVATTKLMRFKDDIVIEIRPGASSKSEVHMRSRSRLGKSDLGANAARIRAYMEKLKERVK